MTARTGAEYRAGLRDDRAVWLGDERVDPATDPRLAGSVTGMAEYFDYQYDHADDCLMEDAETGELVNVSHIIPRSPEDLARRHRALDRLARYSVGMLGRTPDYVNVTLAGFAAQRHIFERNGDTRAGEAIVAYQREVALGDRALTHTIINPVIDKSKGDLEGINGELPFRVVRRTKDSIIVSGSKILGTLGPFADDNFVYPAHPLPPGSDPAFALCFAAPVGAKGVHTVLRDHYGLDVPRADQPFSSRFDEQDAFLIFDEVEVPMEHVFIDGDLQIYADLMKHGWNDNILQQTSIRAAVKLEFAWSLATEVAKVQNCADKPEVSQQLGELAMYAALTRAAITAAETNARVWGSGAYFCDAAPLMALKSIMPTWMVRAGEILKQLGSHNLLCTPSAAAFEQPELGPLLRRYLPGANGVSPEERARIFRTAWDFAGSALGGRVELYERFYLASAPRNLSRLHSVFDTAKTFGDPYREFLEVSGLG